MADHLAVVRPGGPTCPRVADARHLESQTVRKAVMTWRE